MDDRPYLTPEELDFRRDASVTSLGDGRYVIATDGDGAARPHRPSRAGGEPETDSETTTERVDASAKSDETASEARETTSESRESTSEADEPPAETGERDARPDYFVSLAARTDEGTFDTRLAGDDIGAVCASMLRWYARCVSPDDDPAEVLSILLSRSGLGVRDPAADR